MRVYFELLFVKGDQINWVHLYQKSIWFQRTFQVHRDTENVLVHAFVPLDGA